MAYIKNPSLLMTELRVNLDKSIRLEGVVSPELLALETRRAEILIVLPLDLRNKVIYNFFTGGTMSAAVLGKLIGLRPNRIYQIVSSLEKKATAYNNIHAV